ncbi:MAG: hypothetical protein QOE59_1409 [Actinomycetota bacterium]|nr:hypothetical protein [Actinomycetota bacterium]
MTGPPPSYAGLGHGDDPPDAPAGAALLRRAADHLERLRAVVPDGRWSPRGLLASRPEIVAEDPVGNTEHVAEARSRTAQWILTMSPDLATPLVVWLRTTAQELDRPAAATTESTSAAEAFARTLLERDARTAGPSS